MNANELRIGNKVYRNGHLETITGIVRHYDDRRDEYVYKLITNGSLDMPQYIGDFQPIPLSEEWLEKLGFEKSGASFVNTREYEKIQIFPDWKGKQVIYSRTSLKYVHQLQNLYFALTGEELEAK